VDAALNGIAGNGVVSRVWSEDGDGVAGLETVNGGLVGIGIYGVVVGEGVEGGVEVVVDLADVLMKMLAYGC
jgi:hypothetical protein